MPIPLLIIPAAAPFALGAIKSVFTTNLDIAVLGTKAAGKTTLINILQTGRVNTPSQATSIEEKVDAIDAEWTKANRLEKTKILVNERKSTFFKKALSKVAGWKRTGADVPGDESFRHTYEDYIEGKDVLLLLFDIFHYFDPDWDFKDGGKREAQALFDFVYDLNYYYCYYNMLYLFFFYLNNIYFLYFFLYLLFYYCFYCKIYYFLNFFDEICFSFCLYFYYI